MKLLLDNAYPSVVDECHFWVNTTNFEDLQWIKSFSRTSGADWVHLKNLPVGTSIDPRNLWWSVSRFYQYAQTHDTIYVKIDDDTVLVDSLPNFERFLAFRIDHPEYFLVSANVVNNSICSHFMQSYGLLHEVTRITYNSHDKIGMSGDFAEKLHNLVKEKDFDMAKFHFDGSREVDSFIRLCINCIAWFGQDMIGLEIPRDDEIFLSVTMPRNLNRKICVFGGFTICHFAYGTQQHHLLENTSLIDQYHRNCFGKEEDERCRQEKFMSHEISLPHKR